MNDKPKIWNIPVRTAEGKELQRKYAEAWPGLADVDYSSLETRVAAAYMEAFENFFRDKRGKR
jgi:hypothetical protein